MHLNWWNFEETKLHPPLYCVPFLQSKSIKFNDITENESKKRKIVWSKTNYHHKWKIGKFSFCIFWFFVLRKVQSHCFVGFSVSDDLLLNLSSATSFETILTRIETRYRFRVLIPLFRNHPRTIWTYVKPLTDHAISANAVENLFKQFIILSNLMQIKLCWSQ